MPKTEETEIQEPKEPKEPMVPKSKLDERDAELESLRRTLRALEGRGESTTQTPPGSNPIAGFAKIIADEMGWDQKAVLENLTLMDRYASTYAQQTIFPILNGLADRIDGIEARQQYPDYSEYESEIETERQARQARGAYLARTEAYHLVRGRNLPKILEKEKAKTVDDRVPPPTDDAVQGTQKAGPIGGSRLPTPDEIRSMTPDQRKQLLEGLGTF